MGKTTYSIAKVREAKTEYVPGDVIVISNHVKKDNGSNHAFSVEEAMEKLEGLVRAGQTHGCRSFRRGSQGIRGRKRAGDVCDCHRTARLATHCL